MLPKWKIKPPTMSVNKQYWFNSLLAFIAKNFQDIKCIYNIKKNAAINRSIWSLSEHTQHLLTFVQAREATRV